MSTRDPAVRSGPGAGPPSASPPSAGRDARLGRWIPWGYLAAVAGLGVAVLLLVLWVGGGAPERPPAGLPDAGRLVGWCLPVVRLLAEGSAVLAVGTLLAAAVLLPARQHEQLPDRGQLGTSATRCVRTAAIAAGGCAIAAAVALVLTLSDFMGQPPADILDRAQLWSFATQTTQGRALAVQFVLGAVVALGSLLVLTRRAAGIVLAGALAMLAAPALAGHSAASDDHMLAVWSLLVHVVAVSLWVGGLAALALVARRTTKPLVTAVPRFSVLALWCVVAVGVSGAVNAWVRLGTWSGFVSSDYGRLVLAKVAALAVLCWFGWQHRRRTIPALTGRRSGAAFVRLAAVEVAVMAATFGLAVGLSRSPTPVPTDVTASGETTAQVLLGFPMPDPPTVSRLLFDVHLDGFAATLVAVGAALYLAGVRRLRRRGDAWPVGRTAAWLTGLAVVLAVTCTGLGRYAPVLFSAHMVQHMTLNMLAPLLLVLGAPITLALRTLPADGRGTLLAVLHSRAVRVLAHPLVAAAIFVASLYVLYFTPLFEFAMRDHWGHIAMQAHFLASGALFFWVLVGIDPGPKRPPYPLRILLLFMVMAVHAFFSIALMSTTTAIAAGYYDLLDRPWGQSLIDDQHLGGGIGWGFGEVPILLVLITIFVQWVRADERAARASDRAQDRADRRAAAAVDTGAPAADTGAPAPDMDTPAADFAAPAAEDDELARYNAYLASLARADRSRPDRRKDADPS